MVGAALLIAIITLLPKSPHVSKPPVGAQVPTQPTTEQIQLTDIKIVSRTCRRCTIADQTK
jgi:hypothetical protein